MTNFVHLHVHSEYSLLDGLSSCKELAQRAAELGMPAIALTDHGAMYGAVQFYKSCRAADVKPIIGMEAYVAPRSRQDRDHKLDRSPYHLVLLAQNNAGYHNLMRLATIAQLEGFYYKPRIDREVLAEYSEGLIVLSGCGSGEVARLLKDGRVDEAREVINWHREVFPDRYYLEIQEHGIPELTEVNERLIPLAREMEVPLVATNDAHYTYVENADAHDVLLCIQTGKTVTEPNRMRMDGESYYIKSGDEMAALFPDVPEALENTLRIAEQCNVELEFGNYHLPNFKVPEGHDAHSYLRHLCEKGLRERYAEITPKIEERLDYELDIIHRMGFDTYFLIVWDLCRFSQQQDIWWNVRGSGASSIVAYSLYVTNLEPLHQNLIFERFLNEGRVTMPDIDLDYPDDQRADLIRYTIEKYGHEQVAQIVTFGTMGAKAAIRDAGRALDYPLSEVDRVANLVPGGPGVKLDGALESVPDLKQQYEEQDHIRRLIDTARSVEGNIRHASTHAAGVIVTDVPIVNYAPLRRPTSGSDEDQIGVVTQYTMSELEEQGLLKVDFLGLATLTVMRRACKLIRERHGVDLDLLTIPRDDPSIYELLSDGDTTGVFQVEGQGMRRTLRKMQPRRFEHIIAAISLYRPGPMEYIDDYIDRLHGEKPVEYRHPSLGPILEETFGICVSGDAIVHNVATGKRHRLDEINELVEKGEFYLQGIDGHWDMAVGRVSQWVCNGKRRVWEVTLSNGSQIKLTPDHRVLTEQGWRELQELSLGDYVATPTELITQRNTFDRGKLRLLAYLIADGDISNVAAVNFVSKDEKLLTAFEQCLDSFPNVKISRNIAQARGVTRLGLAKKKGHYHAPSDVLYWLRDLGLKHPSGSTPGGCRSHEKFVPDFVFTLDAEHIAWFLAALWDCDGYMGRKLCHYKTISQQLARNVQTLLLKLGIGSTIYEANYVAHNRQGQEVERTSYQVTVYDTALLADWIQPFMVTGKKHVLCEGRAQPMIEREAFVDEVQATTDLSARQLMIQYGIDRQHFYAQAMKRPRIASRIAAPLAEALDLPETQRRVNVHWQEIVNIESVGIEDVYDVTVEGLHNFVANNIIVHNCVYQEQIIRILTDIADYTPGEADLVRRAVSKKKKKALMKHRSKFVEGAIEHSGLPREAAEAIFGDIEYFARYGFNKAHGADYAVLTCQTAYLRANYPVEYMTALLTVERNNTEKIGHLIEECRRMDMEVLPPDVNASGIDFTIEDREDTDGDRESPAIRFGMGAIKNVGEGPVETILKSRQESGPFEDLNDFCERVDLRQVNRRALESLIKVGTLRYFGSRAQLLAIADHIIGLSASVHEAEEIGQMSLFGESTGVHMTAEETLLSTDTELPDVPEKERLAWEKDLVGVYISEHPLTRVLDRLHDVVTCYAGSLSESTKNNQQATIVGMVQRVHRHVTKKSNEMAFVTLEDVHGTCDVVVFPRVWEETKELWQPERILVVNGKVDSGRRDEPNLLCSWVKTPEEVAVPNDHGRPRKQAPSPPPPQPPPPPPETESPRPQSAKSSASGRGVSSPRTIRVTFARSDEKDRDVEKLRQTHRLLTEREGQDHFIIRVVGGADGAVELEFPNQTTGYCPELVEALEEILGEKTVQLE
jgi:DNA polymerase III subunit alpha